jgi:hypothetical protein
MNRKFLLFWFALIPIVVADVASARQTGSERAVAEWVIRQGWRVTLDGARGPVGELAALPAGEARITGIDLFDTLIEPRLRELRLDSTNVSDAGLASLRAMTELRSLNLYHTRVTEKGYEELKTALPGCQIVFDRDSSQPNRRRS